MLVGMRDSQACIQAAAFLLGANRIGRATVSGNGQLPDEMTHEEAIYEARELLLEFKKDYGSSEL